MTKNKKIQTVGWGVWFLMALATAALAGCTTEAAIPERETVRPVKVTVLTAPDQVQTLRYPGRVRASREVDLSFRVSGPLVDLPVRPGQAVKRGQVIARIDPRDFRHRLNKAQAAYTQAHNQYRRYKNLLEENAVSRSAYETSERTWLQAKVAFEEARAALRDTTLRAPFSGTVAVTYVERYQEVLAKQPILSLQNVTRLEVEVQIPEQDVASRNRKLDFDLQVTLDAVPGRLLPAKLKEFTTQADPRTQTFTVTVALERPKGLNILPGMTAELVVRIKGGLHSTRPAGYLVPVEAVVADGRDGSFVWRLERKTMTVHRSPVTLGRMSDKGLYLTSGVEVGQIIVTAGVHHLREGMEVSVLGSGEGRTSK